ncbi:MAG: serine hydrolase [Balneolaceae bacterium]
MKFFLPLIFLLLAPNLWDVNLQDQLKQIDDEFSGSVGVYVKHLGDGATVNYQTDRDWYLASTVKIPIGIAILQKVEEGELSLDDELVVKESDFVDGSGDLMWQDPGISYSLLELLTRMIRDSDSTATDILIRFLEEEKLNEHIRERIISDGIEPITTILQVRYDAYGEIHENAANLTNMNIIELKGVTPMASRFDELLRILEINENDILVNSIPDAFEQYYQRKLNSGSLEAMGVMLEKLAEGEYLNEEHTTILLDIMKSVTTGTRRIQAGLPDGTEFAHKTGTQIGRACNMGIVYLEDKDPVVVAACAENYGELREAEEVFEKVGRTVSNNVLNGSI